MKLLNSVFRIIRGIILILLLTCLVIFLVNNRGGILINLHPLPFEVQTRVFVVIIMSFVVGLALGILACSPSLIQNFFRKISDSYKIKKLEKQMKSN
ncbi:MAG: LapA family protein [Alphaproteobacteria bacterium]|nr:LapA family protein [Alphaproteobacteria bacterium]